MQQSNASGTPRELLKHNGRDITPQASRYNTELYLRVSIMREVRFCAFLEPKYLFWKSTGSSRVRHLDFRRPIELASD